LIGELLLPPYSLGVMSLVGLLVLNKRPRLGRGLIAGAVVLLVVLSFPVFSFWAAGGAQQSATDVRSFVPGPYPHADAIVILGGGRRRFAVEYDAPETADYGTLIRLRYGARLYKQYGYPVLVSGGRPHMGVDRGVLAEADIMKDILENEYGVPVKWVESQSDDTLGNAKNSAPLLRASGVKTLYLVTDTDHSSRARVAFEQQGFQVIETPTLFQPPRVLDANDFKPSINGLLQSRHMLYNLLNHWRARLLS
jgi:uncharacterized SAM-binding protein YcdF (DUF218 family)